MAEEAGDESKIRWLISYADFMMQLVCLFALLFTTSQLPEAVRREYIQILAQTFGRKEVTALMPTVGKFPPLLELIQKTKAGPIELGKEPLERKMKIEQHKEGLLLHFDLGTPMFAEGSSQLTDEPKKVLDYLIDTYKNDIGEIVVIGHTSRKSEDAVPGEDHLWHRKIALSFARALEVQKYIIGNPDRARLDPRIVSVEAMGVRNPRFDEKHDELNQRVELYIKKRIPK